MRRAVARRAGAGVNPSSPSIACFRDGREGRGSGSGAILSRFPQLSARHFSSNSSPVDSSGAGQALVTGRRTRLHLRRCDECSGGLSSVSAAVATATHETRRCTRFSPRLCFGFVAASGHTVRIRVSLVADDYTKLSHYETSSLPSGHAGASRGGWLRRLRGQYGVRHKQ